MVFRKIMSFSFHNMAFFACACACACVWAWETCCCCCCCCYYSFRMLALLTPRILYGSASVKEPMHNQQNMIWTETTEKDKNHINNKKKCKPWVYFYVFHCSAACQLLFILWFYINFKYVLRARVSAPLRSFFPLYFAFRLCMCFKMNAHIFTRSTFYLLCFSIFLFFISLGFALALCLCFYLFIFFVRFESRSVASLIHVIFCSQATFAIVFHILWAIFLVLLHFFYLISLHLLPNVCLCVM